MWLGASSMSRITSSKSGSVVGEALQRQDLGTVPGVSLLLIKELGH